MIAADKLTNGAPARPDAQLVALKLEQGGRVGAMVTVTATSSPRMCPFWFFVA